MKAVLLDMDGTLVDSEKLREIALPAAAGRAGAVLPRVGREPTVGGAPEAGQVRTADVAAIVLAQDLERDLIERARGLQDAIARTLWS